jgi:RND family efflux transporter MFP subunit
MSRANTYWKPTLSAILAAIVLPTVSGCRGKTPEKTAPVRPVRTIVVGDATVLAGRSFPGRASATQEIDLAFRVSGPLSERHVDVGSEVKAEDVVAEIDPRDFKVNVTNVTAQLAEAQTQSRLADSDLRREQDLFKRNPGATTQATLDEKQADRDRAAANVQALTASLATANDQLSDTKLKAPFDGTVVETYVENFQNVRAKQPIVRILDKSQVEMVVGIPETLIHLSSQIKEVKIEFDAFRDRQFVGTIKEIGKEASATTRTFPVTIIMEQPEDLEILPGMAGRASAVAPPAGDADQSQFGIPVTAVFTPTAEDQTYVWVIDLKSETVSRRPVTLGDLISGGYVVKSGLEAGEVIATAGVHFLREGQPVKPIIEKAGGAAVTD